MNGVKTKFDLEYEQQALWAQLTGIEATLLKLHDEEQIVRAKLAHIDIQMNRLKEAGL